MQLKLLNVGQIQEADLRFGDLTVLVGPQATGKSIALQFLKLALDLGYIQEEMGRHGIDWDRKRSAFFNTYLVRECAPSGTPTGAKCGGTALKLTWTSGLAGSSG